MERRLSVALEAGRRCPHILATSVTTQTGCGPMGTGEWKAGELVIEGDLGPAVGRVAGATIATELAEVLIIILVAGHTIRWDAHKDFVHMTGFTGDINMSPGQQEVGPLMIESVIDPLGRDMALPTINRKLTGMVIIFQMASSAETWDADPLPLDVAGFARH
jgi:hypothetical protein